MQLYSLFFLIFLIITIAVYYLAGRIAPRFQWIVLLMASLVFYAYSGLSHLAFIMVTAAATWVCGLFFARFNQQYKKQKKVPGLDHEAKKELKAICQKKKRVVLILGLLCCFGILGYLKYWNEIIGMFRLSELVRFKSHILLPLGISFYTFQATGYLIDTYNGKYEPERNFAKYLLFVSFFPQLIQGPINRFDALATQLYEKHSLKYENFQRAFLIIGFGIMKKYAIADSLAGSISKIFDTTDPGIPGSVVVFGILLYSVQQYMDFSGGIDMVLGIAQLFDIHMTPNFRQPYFSVSLADFWRRWHITLGQWMRDYVFYPFALTSPMQKLGKWAGKHLGRHMGRTLPACVANLLVFFIVGLWHGAAMHNILWGLYNGAVIAASDLLAPAFNGVSDRLHLRTDSKGLYVFRILRTFLIVNIGWYFDRIINPGYCLICFRNTFMNFRADLFMQVLRGYRMNYLIRPYAIALAGCILVFVVSVLKERKTDVEGALIRQNTALRLVLYTSVIMLVLWSFVFTTPTGGFMYAAF